jgi:hypothetical protein
MRRVVGSRFSSALTAPRGVARDPTIAGGQAALAPPVVTAPLQSVLDLRVPKELKKVVVRENRNAIPPGELWKHYAGIVQSAQGNPGAIMDAVRQYMQSEDEVDLKFLITSLAELGSAFDPNSFWATGDKQILTRNMYFKFLIADIIEAKEKIEAAQVPLILYSLACLEYRPARLMGHLVNEVRQGLTQWRQEVLANLAWSLASLNVDDEAIVGELVKEAKRRFEEYPESGSVHDWAQLAFSCTLRGLYGSEYGCSSFLANACSQLRTTAQLDRSGWAQFWIYQTLYCVDVESPSTAAEIQKSVPMWIQERLHFRWLDGILTTCQPQGADLFQLDVDAALKRTNTQALINCSVARHTDEHPCWFAGHKLNPRIAIEYNSFLPIENGEFRPSGWIELKKRMFNKMGCSTVVLNQRSWNQLTEQQKDEQIMLLRIQLGYAHDVNLESKRPSQEVPKKRGEAVKTLKEGAVKWEDQPDWEPHLREPELEFTVHGYKPKDNPNFKGGVRVNHRRRYIANGNHNWVNSLAPKG